MVLRLLVRFINEHRRVPVPAAGGRAVEGIVHVRGFTAGAAGRRVTFERHRPVAVTVRDGDALRRLSIDEPRSAGAPVAVLVPVAAWLLTRMLKSEEK